jgi:hypothetical protein
MNTRVLLLMLCGVVGARAEEKTLAPPYAFTKESPNGRWLFVMLPPGGALKDVPPLYVAETQKLAAKYPASGLYTNDGSTTPIFTVDWYSFRVYPANDGLHVLSIDATSTFTAQYIANTLSDEDVQKQLNAPAVVVYEKDKPIRTHLLKDLVKDPAACKRSVQHLIWLAGEAVDPSGTKLVLNTQDQNQYTFDLSSGDIISQRKTGLQSPRLPYIIAGTTAVVLLCAFGLYRLVKSSTRKQPL